MGIVVEILQDNKAEASTVGLAILQEIGPKVEIGAGVELGVAACIAVMVRIEEAIAAEATTIAAIFEKKMRWGSEDFGSEGAQKNLRADTRHSSVSRSVQSSVAICEIPKVQGDQH